MSMVLWTLLGLLLFKPMINGYTIIVTRGMRDSIQTSIRQKSTGLKCDGNGACQCKERLPNYIFDSTSLAGKCVKDNKIIKDRSKGKLLPGKRRCIGYKNGSISMNVKCSVNNAQWIWTIDEQMLNLKTLRCLRGDIIFRRGKVKMKKAFSSKRCSINAQEQKWACTQPDSRPLEVTNKGTPNFTSIWINPSDDSYFENCDRFVYSYKGCYLFSDGNHMKLVNDAGCDAQRNGMCRLDLEIQAPIDVAMTSCELDWTTSSYAISGSYWYPFNETTIEGFQINSTLYPATLQIKNTSYILTRWPGHLLRLGIKCTSKEGRSESHCALLKVQGTATEEILVANNSGPTTPVITTLSTSNITSQPVKSTVFQYRVNTTSIPTWSHKASTTNTSHSDFNSDTRKDDEDPLMILPIALAAATVVCLLIAVVVVLIICRRRRKRMDITQNEEHIYEEPTFDDNGPASPIYMEIDNVIRSNRKSERSQNRSTSEPREEPTDNPLYHTLERQDHVDVDKDKDIYEEVEAEETLEDPTTHKTFEKELDV